MHILIIDTDKDDLKDMVDILSGWNHCVRCAATAGQAVAVSKKYFFEVILMELIPDQPMGYRIIPDLKLYNPGVSIITMTQTSTPDLEIAAREQGILLYMGKPVDRDQLKQIFDKLVIFHGRFDDWMLISV